MSQSSNSSLGTELATIAQDPYATARHEAVDHEPQVRQRDRLMGRRLSSQRFLAFTRCAAPPPSLETTDALSDAARHEETGMRARMSF